MNNKLIEIYDMKVVNDKFYIIDAQFTLGRLKLTATKGELNRLMAGGNMDRLSKDKYK